MQDSVLRIEPQKDGSFRLVLPEGDVAQLEQGGILSGLAKVKPFGLQVGKAAGAILTVMGWDAFHGFVAGAIPKKIPEWIIPAIGSWVMSTKMAGGFVGSEIANTAGIVLLVNAIEGSPFSPRKLLAGVFPGRQLPQSFEEAGAEKATVKDIAGWLQEQS